MCDHLPTHLNSRLFVLVVVVSGLFVKAEATRTARSRDRSLFTTFCPLRRKLVDAVDWQVANKTG